MKKNATGIFLVNIQSASEQSGGSLWHVPPNGGEISPFPLPPANPVVAVGMVASKRTPLLVTVDGRSLILPELGQGPSAPVTTIKPSRASSAAVGGAGFGFGGRNMSAAPPPTPAAAPVPTFATGDAIVDVGHLPQLGEFKSHLLSAFRQRDDSWARQTNTLAPILSQFHSDAPGVAAVKTLNVAVCQLSRAEVNTQMDGSRLLRHSLDHKQRMHKTFLDYLRQHEVLWEQISWHSRLTLLEHGEALATAAALADYQARLLQKREKRTPVLRRGIEAAVRADSRVDEGAMWKAGLSHEDIFYGAPNLADDPRADHEKDQQDASTPGFNLLEGLKQAKNVAAMEAEAAMSTNFEEAMNLFLDAAIAIETALSAAKKYREEEAELYGLEWDTQVTRS